MPQKQKERPVPRTEENPIQFLLKTGWTYPKLAVAWNRTSDSTVRKLAEYSHVPPSDLATLMAKTFGWKSAGEVVDFWAARVKQRKSA